MGEQVTLGTLSLDSMQADTALQDLFDRLAALEEQIGSVAASAGDLSSLDAALGSNAQAAGADTEALAALTSAVQDLSTFMTASADATTANTEALRANAAAAGENAGAHGLSAMALQRVGMRLTMIGGAGLLATGAFVYMGAKAEDSMNVVQALAAGATDNMAQLTTGVEHIATTIGVSMKAAGDGLYYVISAGFHGQDAINVLTMAMKDAVTSGTDLATVANGLTSYINAMGGSAKDAGHYSDMMIAAVTAGKMTFHDFSEAIGRASVFGHIFGIKANEVAASIARMTQEGLQAPIAGENLSYLFRSIGDADKVAAEAEHMGLAFDKAGYQNMSFIEKLKYLRDGIGATALQFDKFIGGARGTVAAGALLNDGGKGYAAILDQVNAAQGKTDAAFKEHQQTLEYGVQKIGGALSVFSYQIEQIAKPAIVPVLQAIAGAFNNLANFIQQHKSVVVPVLAALGFFFGTVLVIGLAAFVGAMVAAMGAVDSFIAPIIGVIAAVAALGAGANWLVNQLGGWHKLMLNLQPVFDKFGKLVSAAWKDIQKAFENPAIHKALHDLQAQLPSLIPVFQVLGAVLGAVIVAIVGVGVALLQGIAMALPGIITMIQGFINFWGGFFRLIKDIATGKWGDIWEALKQMLGGGVQFFYGAFAGILGLVTGFVNGVITFFQHLADVLVGHSIIPDLVKAIIQWFASLPGKIVGLLLHLATGAITQAQQMAAGVLRAIVGLVTGSGHHTRQMAQQTAMHAAQMRVAMEQHTAQMHLHAAAQLDALRRKLLDELAHTTDGTKRHALEMRIAMVTNAEQMHIKAAQHAEQLAKEGEKHLRTLAQKGQTQGNALAQAVVGALGLLPIKGLATVLDLDVKLAKFFAGLATKALRWGGDFIGNLVKGITAAVPNVTNAVQNVASTIARWLHHSRPDVGPLRDDHLWMTHFGDNLVQGLQAQVGRVHAAVGQLAAAFSPAGAGMGALNVALAGHAMASAAMGASAITGAGARGQDGATTALLGSILTTLRGTSGVARAGSPIGGPVTHNTSLTLNNVPGTAVAGIAAQVLRERDERGNRALRRPGGFRRFGGFGGL